MPRVAHRCQRPLRRRALTGPTLHQGKRSIKANAPFKQTLHHIASLTREGAGKTAHDSPGFVPKGSLRAAGGEVNTWGRRTSCSCPTETIFPERESAFNLASRISGQGVLTSRPHGA